LQKLETYIILRTKLSNVYSLNTNLITRVNFGSSNNKQLSKLETKLIFL